MNTIKISDYTEYQTIISHVMTYQGAKALNTGDVIDSKDTKLSTMIGKELAKKLNASSVLKDDATVYEYVTARDKLKGTVTKYAKISDIVDKDITKNFRGLINDITNRLMSGEITAEQAQLAIETAKQSITA